MPLSKDYLDKLLRTAEQAARLAGGLAISEMKSINVSIKNNTELVTQADVKCQQAIIEHIEKTFPGHGFLGEEGSQGKIYKKAPCGREDIWWIIDPIDGTNNYAHGIRAFSVSIAAMHDGYPVAGVIFDPSSDLMFTGTAGGPARLNGREISASDEDISIFTNMGIDSHFPGQMPGWAMQLSSRTRFRNLGSTALHLAYVASGGLFAAIAASPKLWDIAAGSVIAQSAGAVVTDWQAEALFPLDVPGYTGGAIKTLIANPKTHSELVEIIKTPL